MFEQDVWKNDIQNKKVNRDVVRGLYDDFLEDPRSFKFDVLWLLDGTTMLNYLWFLIEQPTLNQHIWETYDQLQTDPTVKDLVETLEAKQISGPIFREFILQKNGMTPEVVCLRIEMIDDAVEEIEERSLTNQLLLEYIDKDAASETPEHKQIVQLRTDLIDVLELDCNERLLRDEPDRLINEWILRSETLQTLIL